MENPISEVEHSSSIKRRKVNWRKLGFEFLSIFIAVTSAFALNNWSENRRDAEAGDKIMAEISNGLQKDIDDIRVNMEGHNGGIEACKYWRDLINGKPAETNLAAMQYFNLTRDFISIQNISGYESLKSKGLELIKDDELRYRVINLYEYDYSILKKFEEDYNEMQYQENYFEAINELVAPNFQYDTLGNITDFETPLRLSNEEKKLFMSYLWKIQSNRTFILRYYTETEEKLVALREEIEKGLKH